MMPDPEHDNAGVKEPETSAGIVKFDEADLKSMERLLKLLGERASQEIAAKVD